MISLPSLRIVGLLLGFSATLVFYSWAWASSPHSSSKVHIAVASNFAPTLRKIIELYQQSHPQAPTLKLITGSSGKHYAQILRGAPYDLFFSADQQKPQALIAKGVVLKQQVFTYAIGRLVLWTHQHTQQKKTTDIPIQQRLSDSLKRGKNARTPKLAIANPALAPYGLAAKQTLQKLTLWKALKQRIVLGENINQTFHFVHSKALTYGFIAYSQWLTLPSQVKQLSQHSWVVPTHYHQPIIQQGAMIKPNQANEKFIQFIQSPKIQQWLTQNGYPKD